MTGLEERMEEAIERGEGKGGGDEVTRPRGGMGFEDGERARVYYDDSGRVAALRRAEMMPSWCAGAEPKAIEKDKEPQVLRCTANSNICGAKRATGQFTTPTRGIRSITK